MGVFRLSDVPVWDEAASREERVFYADPDDAEPIGTRAPSVKEHTATWIHFDQKTGELVYGDEKSIEVYRSHEKTLPHSLQAKLGLREIRGWLLQVRKTGPIQQPESFELLSRKDVMLSKLPHARNYFVKRTLKLCKHDAAIWARIERMWDKYPGISFADERLDQILQDMAVTPFINHQHCSAAWAILPKRFDVLGDDRFDSDDDYTVAALDIPFEKAMGLLSVHPYVLNALELTESLKLFGRYRSAAEAALAKKPHLGPVRLAVTDELYANRKKIMEAACWAALCGRHLPDARNSVAHAAILLYHRFAYGFVRRKDADPIPGNITMLIDHILNAPEESMDEAFVSTLLPALLGWPPGRQRPEGFEKARQRLERRQAQIEPDQTRSSMS